MRDIFLVILSYLIGSISFACIISRLFKGIDIRTVGDKNAGAANIYRHVGLIPAILVFMLDTLKGAAVILLASYFGAPLIIIFGCGFSVIVGHTWPIFFRFRGGRGVATVVGILLVLMPNSTLLFIAIMMLIILLTNNMSAAVASIFIGSLLLSLIIEKRLILFAYILSLGIVLWAVSQITDKKLTVQEKEESMHLRIR